jgi:hypothetical protein
MRSIVFFSVFIGAIHLTAASNPTLDKSEEIKNLIKILESPKAELVSDLHQIPDQVFLEIQQIMDRQYGQNDEDKISFEIYDQFEAPSRSYRFEGNNSFRKFNFALRKGDSWLISYHVTTRRFSYNNLVYFDGGRKDIDIRSYQISRGSQDPESLKAKLNQPEMVEILYPTSAGSPFVIF